jgi:hypothetical protein
VTPAYFPSFSPSHSSSFFPDTKGYYYSSASKDYDLHHHTQGYDRDSPTVDDSSGAKGDDSSSGNCDFDHSAEPYYHSSSGKHNCNYHSWLFSESG